MLDCDCQIHSIVISFCVFLLMFFFFRKFVVTARNEWPHEFPLVG